MPVSTTRMSGPELAARLAPLIARELASIGAIDAARRGQTDPGYSILYHESKEDKQAAVGQMMSLVRMAGEQPTMDGGWVEPVLKAQTRAAQALSTTVTLRGMRVVEDALVDAYRPLLDVLDGTALEAMARVTERAVRRWHLLTAHIAKRTGDADETSRLPHPLSDYFAGEEARACMRCLLDRPGDRGALEVGPPRPVQYVCAACHDEALASFPPDLREQADRWTPDARRDRVILRALGRPLKVKAREEVLTVLSGLAPRVRVPASGQPRKEPAPRPADTAPDPALPVLHAAAADATPSERAYSDLLFDFRSVRNSW